VNREKAKNLPVKLQGTSTVQTLVGGIGDGNPVDPTKTGVGSAMTTCKRYPAGRRRERRY